MKSTSKAAKVKVNRKTEKKVIARTLREDELMHVAGGGKGKAKTAAADEAPKETITFEYGGLQVR